MYQIELYLISNAQTKYYQNKIFEWLWTLNNIMVYTKILLKHNKKKTKKKSKCISIPFLDTIAEWKLYIRAILKQRYKF